MKDNNPIMVSIHCLVYNHEAYLRQCLESILMQKTCFRFEVIVHDDASTDGSATIIQEFASRYPSIIKPIFEKENQYSKHDDSLDRIMLNHTRGVFVAFCEGDDYWTNPHKLQIQYDAMMDNPDCTIAFAKVLKVNRVGEWNGLAIPSDRFIKAGKVSLSTYLEEEFYYGRWAFHTLSFFIRKNVMDDYLWFRYSLLKDFPYGDMPIALQCLRKGNGIYIDEVVGSYRMFSGGYNSGLASNARAALDDRRKLIRGFNVFDEYTDYKYHRFIERRITRTELEIGIIEKNRKEIIKPKYYKVVLQRNWRGRLLYLINVISPSLYNIITTKFRH